MIRRLLAALLGMCRTPAMAPFLEPWVRPAGWVRIVPVAPCQDGEVLLPICIAPGVTVRVRARVPSWELIAWGRAASAFRADLLERLEEGKN